MKNDGKIELIKSSIKFGTDGWRGIIGEDFTFENVRIIAQAYADYLIMNAKPSADKRSVVKSQQLRSFPPPRVVIGFDCRFLSEMFASETASVLRSNGLKVVKFKEPVPTPFVSWSVRQNNYSGGVVITASHNPAEFNGFKVKAPYGGSVSEDVTAKIESLLGNRSVPQKSELAAYSNPDEIVEISRSSYNTNVEKVIDLDFLASASESVVFDSMHGAGGKWIESFLQKKQLRFETIRARRDPLFGGVNPEPIDVNLAKLKNRVLETNSIMGIATDGDADRIGAVNQFGTTMTMHEIAPILLLHLVKNKGLSGGVVATISQSVLTRRIAKHFKLPVFETPIGFKFIVDLMLAKDILIGAEESGGIGIKGHIPERDGILSSLLLMEAVLSFGKNPTEIVKEIHHEFGGFYYGRKDLQVDASRGREFLAKVNSHMVEELVGEDVVEVNDIDGVKFIFKDESWLLFRQSGTEPIMRLYCETVSKIKLKEVLTKTYRKVKSATR